MPRPLIFKQGPTKVFTEEGLALGHRIWHGISGYGKPGRMPREIAIESATRCNADCHFCPVNRNADPRPHAQMSMELIAKICTELKACNYSGQIDLFLNNEPTLDDRIEEICAQFKSAAPRAVTCIFTNGRTLSIHRFRSLFAAGLDRLFINDYSGGAPSWQPKTAILLDALSTSHREDDRHSARHTVLIKRHYDEKLANRIGYAPNRTDSKPPDHLSRLGCFRPFYAMPIRHDGKVGQCCHDTLGETTLGDCNTQSIADIWTGEAFDCLRKILVRDGRGATDPCSRCDGEISPFNARFKHTAFELLMTLRSAK